MLVGIAPIHGIEHMIHVTMFVDQRHQVIVDMYRDTRYLTLGTWHMDT